METRFILTLSEQLLGFLLLLDLVEVSHHMLLQYDLVDHTCKVNF